MKQVVHWLITLWLFAALLNCSSQRRFIFQQPAGPHLIELKGLAIAPIEGAPEGDLIYRLLDEKLRQDDYFEIADPNNIQVTLSRYQLTFEQIKQLDTLRPAASLLNIDGIIFLAVKSFKILPDEHGSEMVSKNVWTGEYERDQFGQIIEEPGPNGELVKKKKIKLQTVEQLYTIRQANAQVLFQLIDLRKRAIAMSRSIESNYRSEKIIKEESQRAPTDDEIKRTLAIDVVNQIVSYIAPRKVSVKRAVEPGTALLDSGAVLARQGQWRQAQQVWLEAERQAPTDARVYYNLGLAAEAQGRYSEAEVYYKKAALLNPKRKLYQAAAKRIREFWQKVR
ncbi:MAG: tetratricopeptide repeat protein [candidate division KSB1 bacterium]|nr:tetratricopeptide repeat protein [candidate division KSB1 bacterium]MDZ7335757.1 tetratricopeptide repeat protein [candidate division KSB1 bacterium]MDZ7357492.1 tetratricopeptide repeat protein [candidate division KSB1 bacterium]MDZ7376386.1 tetratricopeptide repeat protein [candidate division KSB1 bacterium]MDZ7402075.1 tetratricopeptide repeat protein [candidate division KSB1 bacterium]